jgi:hypothetical protein
MQLEAAKHDALLLASRRIDWRFLLPDPDLGRVACIGVTDPKLLESLRLFSAELVTSESGRGGSSEAAYDLLVLQNPREDSLDAASGLLRPGGWLYLEVKKSLKPVETHASRSARGYARALRKRGFVDVGTYVHWPDFPSCRAIVPLDDAAAVRHGVSRARTGQARLLTRLAPVLAGSHQLALFVPCASVLGRLPSQDREAGP